jgi:polyphosphate kinase 2 (PPK2 family)
MFESAEIGHKIDKDTYKKAVPELRAALLDAQFDLKENGKIPVIVLVSGPGRRRQGRDHQRALRVDGPALHLHPGVCRTDRRGARAPFMWRYWRALPPKGRVGIFRRLVVFRPDPRPHHDGGMTKGDLDARIDQINRFEAMLVNEGALVLKFWFHLTKDGQRSA